MKGEREEVEITIEIEGELLEKVKMVAYAHGLSVERYVEYIIDQYVEENQSRLQNG